MKHKRMISFRLPLILICIMLIAMLYLDIELRPVLREMARKNAQNSMNVFFNTCVNDLLLEDRFSQGSDFYEITREDSGKIINVELNQYQTNLFKTTLYQRILSHYQEDDYVSVTVPLSSAMNLSILPTVWPEFTFRYKIASTIDMNISTEMITAGINQTLQIITLHTKCDIYIVLPGTRTSAECDFEYILCENLIVGEVPQTYFSNTSDILNQTE